MAQQISPALQYEFGGIVTAGHPLKRPISSSVVCNNFRVMPGGWLRLRGGRTLKAASSGAIYQFYEFRRSEGGGGIYHLAQKSGAWYKLDLSNFTMTSLETITGGGNSAAAVCSLRDRVVFANGLGVRNGTNSRPALSQWNGSGSNVRYVGLDAYCVGGNPIMSFVADTSAPTGVNAALASGGTLATGGPFYYKVTAVSVSGESIGSTEVNATPSGSTKTINLTWTAVAGATSYKVYRTSATGNYTGNHLLGSPTTTSFSDDGSGSLSAGAPPAAVGNFRCVYSRTFYVGVHNTTTGHFGNGVLIGTASSTNRGKVTTGTVTLSDLTRLKLASHDATEAAELKYVFYVTLDGGATPYLLMDTNGIDPLTTSSSSITIGPSNTSDLGGYSTDVTQEMPTANHPPRPMKSICYTNGRIYGILDTTGSGGDRTFSYVVADRDLPAIVWSATADDSLDRDFVGVPEESWPLTNKKYTSNGEAPLMIAPSPNRSQVLVITRGGTYLLEETADGLHEWYTVSPTDGIVSLNTFTQTPFGPMWITQRNQLVLLKPGDDRLTVLSGDFPELFRNIWAQFVCADYLQDPTNSIDRYQVWTSDGNSVCYDLAIGGQAYTAIIPTAYTAARTVVNSAGQRFHLCCDGTNIYAQEQDPLNGLIPLRDQTGSSTHAEINGDYVGQWQDFGDSTIRKEVTQLDIVGDGALSTYLQSLPQGGQYDNGDGTVTVGTPAILSWYRDLSATERTIAIRKTTQSETDGSYRGKVKDAGNVFWFKVRVQMKGHWLDGGLFYSYPSGGDLSPSMYGAVMALRYTMNPIAENRS